MRGRSVAILALVVGVLAGYILLVDRNQLSTDARRAASTQILTERQSSPTSIRIERGETIVVLERTAGDPAAGDPAADGWRMVTPFDAPADATRVRTLLDALRTLESSRRVSNDPISDFGLDRPRARLALATDEDAEGIALRVGADVPGTDDVLMGIEDTSGEDPVSGDRMGAIHQVDRAILAALGPDDDDWPRAWRDPRLFPASRHAIARVALQANGETVVLARANRTGDDDAVAWRIVNPIDDRADPNAVSRLLTALTELRAARIYEEGATTVTATAETLEVSIANRDTPFIVELAAVEKDTTQGTREATVDGRRVDLAADALVGFDPDPDAWRDRRWTRFQVFVVAQARVEDAEGILTLTREDATWRRDDTTIDFAIVSDLLYAVADLESTQFLARDTLPAAVLERPSLTFTLRDEQGDADRLTLAQIDDAHEVPRWVAWSEGREVALVIENNEALVILARLRAVRAARASESKDESMTSAGTESESETR